MLRGSFFPGAFARAALAVAAAFVTASSAQAQYVSIEKVFEKLDDERQRAALEAKRRAARAAAARAAATLPRPELKKLDATGTANRDRLLPVLDRVRPKELPLGLADAVVALESGWHIDARGSAGEIGLMQIKPVTAERFADAAVGGETASAEPETLVTDSAGADGTAIVSDAKADTADAEAYLFDPATNLRIGTRFLYWCYQRARGNVGETIGCYNAGPSKMRTWAINPITRRYVSQVHGLMGTAPQASVVLTSAHRIRSASAAKAAPAVEAVEKPVVEFFPWRR